MINLTKAKPSLLGTLKRKLEELDVYGVTYESDHLDQTLPCHPRLEDLTINRGVLKGYIEVMTNSKQYEDLDMHVGAVHNIKNPEVYGVVSLLTQDQRSNDVNLAGTPLSDVVDYKMMIKFTNNSVTRQVATIAGVTVEIFTLTDTFTMIENGNEKREFSYTMQIILAEKGAMYFFRLFKDVEKFNRLATDYLLKILESAGSTGNLLAGVTYATDSGKTTMFPIHGNIRTYYVADKGYYFQTDTAYTLIDASKITHSTVQHVNKQTNAYALQIHTKNEIVEIMLR